MVLAGFSPFAIVVRIAEQRLRRAVFDVFELILWQEDEIRVPRIS